MPYELEQETLRHKFLNPTQITILLSLGIHVLIYIYGFPSLFVQEQIKKTKDFVSTISLDPLEQARLPNLDEKWQPPQAEIDDLNDPAAPFAFPLPPNFDPNDISAPPIPPGYKFPDIPVPGSSPNIKLPPLGVTDLSNLPSPPPLEELEKLLAKHKKLPASAVKTPPERKSPPQPPKPPTQTKNPAPPKPEVKPEPKKVVDPKPSPEEIKEAREEKLTKDVRSLSSSLQKQTEGTTDDEARKNYVSWASRVQDVAPIVVNISGLYPRDACIRRLEGSSVYGVVLDTNNKVVALELIKGAEYAIFNERASKDIQKHNFANTQKLQPYRVMVDYKYNKDICPSLSLPSLRDRKPLPEGESIRDRLRKDPLPPVKKKIPPIAQ